MGRNYIPIPRPQGCNRWSLGMDKWFYPTLFLACGYLLFSKKGPKGVYEIQSVDILSTLTGVYTVLLWTCEALFLHGWLVFHRRNFKMLLKYPISFIFLFFNYVMTLADFSRNFMFPFSVSTKYIWYLYLMTVCLCHVGNGSYQLPLT